MKPAPLVLLLLSVSLSGCFRGSNIRGDFACKAPGGSCAPMSTIDGEAIAGIASAGMGTIRTPGSLPPPSAPLRSVAPAGPDDTAPARTTERVLRVVFPAHIDRDGIYREEAAAHAVVEPTQWAQALGAPATEPHRLASLRQGGAVAAVPASVAPVPAASRLATMDEVVAAQAARRAGAAAAPAPAAAPIPSAATPPGAAPLAGAVMAPFAGPSRAGVPLSLAEAAAGLMAPPTPHLEPAGPGNYDTPDVTAAIRPAPPVAGPKGPVATSAVTGASADAVMRTVRWKGKTVRIWVAPGTAGPAASDTAPLTTAELNRRALAKAGGLPAAPGAEGKEETDPRASETTAAAVSQPASALPPARPQAAAAPAADRAAADVRTMARPHLDTLAAGQAAPMAEVPGKAPQP